MSKTLLKDAKNKMFLFDICLRWWLDLLFTSPKKFQKLLPDWLI
jgi:hypothetical protein